MLLSQADIQSADLSFDPPLEKRRQKRDVYLIAKHGAILKGITIVKKKGDEFVRIQVPQILLITNRPEHSILDIQIGNRAEEVEQPVSELSREVLATRIRERLANRRTP